MKITVKRPTEIEVARIKVILPVRYEEEDIPNSFPLRNGDKWSAEIEVDTGKIIGWPQGQSGEMYMKVTDSGYYALLAANGDVIAELEDYVPSCIPGEDSDYVGLNINSEGIITNWKPTSFSEFFPNE